jgi:hypothetical protein
VAKFIEIDLLSKTPSVVAPLPPTVKKAVPQAPKASPTPSTKTGKKLYLAIALALFVIVIGIGSFLFLSRFTNKMKNAVTESIVTTNPAPPVPTDTIPRPAPEPEGLIQIQFIGTTAPIFESLKNAKGEIFSASIGPEGILLFDGIVPGENPKVDSGAPLLSGDVIKEISILKTAAAKKGVAYLASAKISPLVNLDFDPEPVPPYLRGQVLSEIDSLAHSAGLKDIVIEVQGQTEVPGGSRFAVNVLAKGNLLKVTDFVKRIESSKQMVCISRFALEGVSRKNIKEDILRAGFIIDIYDLQIPALSAQPIAESKPDSVAKSPAAKIPPEIK